MFAKFFFSSARFCDSYKMRKILLLKLIGICNVSVGQKEKKQFQEDLLATRSECECVCC